MGRKPTGFVQSHVDGFRAKILDIAGPLRPALALAQLGHAFGAQPTLCFGQTSMPRGCIANLPIPFSRMP